MASCGKCNNAVNRSQLKIKCSECSGTFHANCVNMSKSDIEYINAEKQFCRCPGCTQERRQSMATTTETDQGIVESTTIVTMLQEAKHDRRRMEKD